MGLSKGRLMTRTTKHGALDVHQATTIAPVRGEHGRVIARDDAADGGSTRGVFRGMRGTINVAFEEATQEQWLHDVARRWLIGSSCVIGEGSAARSKGDQVDADALSEL